jgi:hypothetical protein
MWPQFAGGGYESSLCIFMQVLHFYATIKEEKPLLLEFLVSQITNKKDCIKMQEI